MLPSAPLPALPTLFPLLWLLQGSSVLFPLCVLSAPPLPTVPLHADSSQPAGCDLTPWEFQEQLPSRIPRVFPEDMGPKSQPVPEPISLRSLFYSSSVHSSHLFLISSASIRSLSFLSFMVPIFQWSVVLIFPIFLKSSLVFTLSVVTLYFFAFFSEEGLPISPAILWNSAFSLVYLSLSPLLFLSLLFSAVCKASSENLCAFLHLFFFGMVLFAFFCTIFREGNGTPLQYSCLENPMDGGAWKAAVHGVAKSQTQLSDFPFTFHFHALEKEMATHSSVLAWRIPWAKEPGRLQSMGSRRVRHN